jgi:hypothetical protein
VDRKNNFKDVPNDYAELGTPQTVRYIRYQNIHVPTRNLSISDLRIFGIDTENFHSQLKIFQPTANQTGGTL